MIANYHTHTWRCSHATGTEEEYVQAALDRKLEILGFSDHTPYGFPQGYDSWFRMKQEQLADYCNTRPRSGKNLRRTDPFAPWGGDGVLPGSV